MVSTYAASADFQTRTEDTSSFVTLLVDACYSYSLAIRIKEAFKIPSFIGAEFIHIILMSGGACM